MPIKIKPLLRITLYALILITLLLLIGASYYFRDRIRLIPSFWERSHALVNHDKNASKKTLETSLRQRADEAYQYALAHQFDLEHAVLINFSIHSGANRFFVWDFTEQQPIIESLVAHGYGAPGFESTNQSITFSNTPDSYASSLGKYRLGERSWSRWGINIHYKMHGLEPTNDNAFRRYIVLHSFDKIPTDETFPKYLPMGYSQGCPVISDEAMRRIDALLQTKTKPVLLWIYIDEP
ncbi:murein L,D-transpeptidase catalytic domain family protein [Ignatzschineria sp. RMDPL8A]|uniref:murein L,D-transpeptidase catalytic domain-containing protein n=1 Tax=Ignatzschineria sp. RMDPL8A TaxID=2999236 RepID=UPI0024467C7B|nr:murein L,D-transpeptidase catalytic domain family protein [Ignatzschineria sp. RMDPL8A]MDG9730147.1 murein L,D-transpeptidase catalytic domain family protein [Ignatzschineria sp. RMDPL8A]